jgi:hypothetical protein
MALTQTNKKIGALAPRRSEPETKNAKFGAQQKFGEGGGKGNENSK